MADSEKEGRTRRPLTYDDPRGLLTIQNRNICVKRAACEVRRLCKTMCIAPCRKCRDWLCDSLCPDFECSPCPKLEHTPFCYNSCNQRQGYGCSHLYRFYEAKYAQDLANARRSEARSGIGARQVVVEASRAEGYVIGVGGYDVLRALPLGEAVLDDVDGVLEDLRVAVYMGTLAKLDSPKAVRYRPRSKSSDRGKSPQIPRAALEGRRWSDFQALDAADRENAVEMDTVVGRQGKDEQCILTMFVRRIGFQFYILLPDKTTESVIHAIDTFQDIYGTRFGKVFSLVVCDRGSELADAERIEHGKNGKRRLRLYYTDPQQSQQKPKAERRHAELRRILPKGKTDFDRLTGRDMAACMGHVNSYMVGSMGWASPMDLAMALFPKGLLCAYGVERIDPKEVSLTPSLVPHAIVKL